MFVDMVCHCTHATVMRLFSKSLQEMVIFCGRGNFAETGSCDAVVRHAAVPVWMTICLRYRQSKPQALTLRVHRITNL
jgi:hypothetical protein